MQIDEEEEDDSVVLESLNKKLISVIHTYSLRRNAYFVNYSKTNQDAYMKRKLDVSYLSWIFVL